MADKKITQKDIYTAIREVAENGTAFGSIPADTVIEFCDKKLEQLANKASATNSKKDDEKEKFIEVLCTVMNGLGKVQCGALLEYPEVVGFEWADKKKTSGQRCSYMLNEMVHRGLATKVTEKKVSYFSLVTAE